ncbi:hypothetical protein Y032_0128g1447 [Ancylostoma ceylanicum]|uniref:ShKT domain-containing protein n=1 Tax=Ancylostoma ceylanicum TaxID=53326 RepID=A0A016T848_9BILA|nr:hypothetical protein Y032_0128g1447 [Ancylostoma ceylanicum]
MGYSFRRVVLGLVRKFLQFPEGMGVLQYLLFAALACRSYGADPIAADLNCTYLDGQTRKFDATAVNCPNKFPDAECKALFPLTAQHDEVAAGSQHERPKNCLKAPLLRQMAITNCPKWCGYCCISPAYNCKNKPNPRITCERITQDMCENPYWKEIIAEDCPVVCGFCDKPIGNCKDLATGCGNDLSICTNIYMQDFVKENCKRTCGFCSGGGGNCKDLATGCGNDLSICINIYMKDFVKMYELGSKRVLHQHLLHCGSEEKILWQTLWSLLKWPSHALPDENLTNSHRSTKTSMTQM